MNRFVIILATLMLLCGCTATQALDGAILTANAAKAQHDAEVTKLDANRQAFRVQLQADASLSADALAAKWQAYREREASALKASTVFRAAWPAVVAHIGEAELALARGEPPSLAALLRLLGVLHQALTAMGVAPTFDVPRVVAP